MNVFGNFFRLYTFGESHGKALGCIIDGCPSGLLIRNRDIQKYLYQRRPGKNKLVSLRREQDKIQILSGIFHQRSTGTPICIIVYNIDQRSNDYNNISHLFRPGHADYTYFKKYKTVDYRGGGRASARTTLSIVIGGSIARIILERLYNIKIFSYLSSVGDHIISTNDAIQQHNIINSTIEDILKKNDSVGGTIRIQISNIPPSLGNPLFMKIEAELFCIFASLNAVKAIELGSGIRATTKTGSVNNDQITSKGFLSNHAGGIFGGITSGQDIFFQIYIKPTSSIRLVQCTINKNMQDSKISILGRHDPCVALRAIPILEASACLVLLDLILYQRSVAYL
ncbi:chorismate synthase [Candidatus Vidania fulgoroideorum]